MRKLRLRIIILDILIVLSRRTITLFCANEIPHVTICTFNDGKPVDSNNITEWKDIEPIIVNTKLEVR